MRMPICDITLILSLLYLTMYCYCNNKLIVDQSNGGRVDNEIRANQV